MNKQTRIWKEVPGFGNLFEASSEGDIRVKQRTIEQNLGNGKMYLRTIKAKELKQRADKKGYKYVDLCFNSSQITRQVHRLVAAAFYGKSDLEVDHLDFTPSNNNVDNLEYVSRKENGDRKHNRMWKKGPIKKIRGVYPTKSGKWRAQIGFKSKLYSLGTYENQIDAVKAVEDKTLELYGSHNE
jgi:hypothetical protein